MQERVKKLKEMQNNVKPSFSSERARLVTEAVEKYAVEPLILQKAHMLSYILQNMTIFIQEGELVVGNHTDHPRCAPVYPEFSSEWIVEQIDEFPLRISDPLQITPEDRKELLGILAKWKGKSLDKVLENVLPKDAMHAEESGVMTMGNRDCATGHIIPDYYNILKSGLIAYKEQCKKQLNTIVIDSKEKQEQADFWSAAIITIDASEQFALRYSKLAEQLADKEMDTIRREELLAISRICQTVPMHAPDTFAEALQCVWFLHLIVTIESNGHGNSFARFDQYMNDFYIRDLEVGRITKEQAVELLECFFIKTTDIIKLRDKFYSESFAGYPVWQNMIIGGQTKDGKDAANEMSHLVLLANKEVQTSQPTVSVRYFDGLSQQLMDESIEMIQQGMATPAFFNDKLVVPMIQEKFGATLQEAREWGILGCVEPCIPGYTDGRPTVGYVNLLKCLELVLHNGVNPVNGEQLGPKTGNVLSFSNLEELQKALYIQIDYFVDLMLSGFNIVGSVHSVRQQMPFASLMIQDCIKNGKSIQNGGARFSESGAFICGIGNVSDAVAAMDTLVFQKKIYQMDELITALEKNFDGYEQMRLTLLNKAPKYGNDDDYVDGIAAGIVAHYRESLLRYRDSRKGKFTVVVESQSMNVSQGKCVLASADGRFAHEPVNDNCSPVMGRDINGPTATINSVAKLDQNNAQDGCLYNIRFDPRSIQGEKGKIVLQSVVTTYFNHMGEHIQINVVDDETLRAAQREPEKYRNLLVRVAGYLAYFTELDKDVQDNVIARTSHTVC